MSLDLFRVSGGIQIDESTQILEGAAAPTVDAPVGSVYTETTSGNVFVKIAAGAGAANWSELADVSYVDGEISAVNDRIDALGNAFNYVGLVSGGASGSAYDLATLPAGSKDAGDYYKVDSAGYFKVGASPEFFANVGDGLVFNTAGGVDKIDNTNSAVSGTTDYVAVSGSTDTGFVVDIDTAFKTRVSTAESNISGLQSSVSTLQTDLLAEVTNRTNADTTLQNNINAEATARSNADTTLQNNINAEATARSDADSALDGRLTTAEGEIDTLQALTKVTTATATSLTDTVTADMAKWIVHAQDATTAADVSAFEVFAANNGTTADYSRYGILKLGNGVTGIAASVALVAGDMVLTVSATGSTIFTIRRVSLA